MANDNTQEHLQLITDMMRSEGMPDIAISSFKNLYQQLVEGNSGYIPESSIEAVHDLPGIDDLQESHSIAGSNAISKTVILKLNGGLGTSMGLNKAKSLIPVREQFSFLDLIAQQAIHKGVHLLLMNSFNTRQDSVAELEKYPLLKNTNSALDFLQHKVPKINQEDLSPAQCPNEKHLQWHPPGHGDIYIALVSSGLLEELLKVGYRYVFISNADNLGAVLDEQLLGYMLEQQLPFLMEVTERTEADKKGGHLALRPDGRLVLRESAQCRDEDLADFENITKHGYFNTNNLWIDLQKLQETLLEKNNVLELPLICNSKTLDPRNDKSASVYQLETAMGSGISIFEGAQAIRVPRSRFAPVKTTEDLLLVRSDVYELNDDFTLTSKLSPANMPLINLDDTYYKLIDDFEARFPCGPPSLLNCQGLDIKGDIAFSENISIKGKVSLQNDSKVQVKIPSNTCLDKNQHWKK